MHDLNTIQINTNKSTILIVGGIKMNKENKPKKEFSKKIFNIVITLFIIVLFYSMALMWKVGTTDGLMYLIPAVGTLASVTVGFYYWKIGRASCRERV